MSNCLWFVSYNNSLVFLEWFPVLFHYILTHLDHFIDQIKHHSIVILNVNTIYYIITSLIYHHNLLCFPTNLRPQVRYRHYTILVHTIPGHILRLMLFRNTTEPATIPDNTTPEMIAATTMTVESKKIVSVFHILHTSIIIERCLQAPTTNLLNSLNSNVFCV